MSAAAFTQGLLDLEGSSLTPILVRLLPSPHPPTHTFYWFLCGRLDSSRACKQSLPFRQRPLQDVIRPPPPSPCQLLSLHCPRRWQVHFYIWTFEMYLISVLVNKFSQGHSQQNHSICCSIRRRLGAL